MIDYVLKACIIGQDPRITSTGRSICAGVWSQSKPRLLNKLNYVAALTISLNLSGKTSFNFYIGIWAYGGS
jgi:hypothetical protein